MKPKIIRRKRPIFLNNKLNDPPINGGVPLYPINSTTNLCHKNTI